MSSAIDRKLEHIIALSDPKEQSSKYQVSYSHSAR